MKRPKSGLFASEPGERRLRKFLFYLPFFWIFMSLAVRAGDLDSSEKIAFSIPQQRADKALIEFAIQADITFFFSYEQAQRETANALQGQYTRGDALRILLRNTRLTPVLQGDGSLAIRTSVSGTIDTQTDQGPGILGTLFSFFGIGKAGTDLSGEKAYESTRGATKGKMEEVIVTASRRDENLQDVSASISALTMEKILRQGFDDFESVARSVPGLTLSQPVRNRAILNIRGLVTTTTGNNTQDTVSVYINDMPITDTFAAVVQPDLRLYDVERIEVLRGPQGTLFGSGSLGGTLRIITKKPDLNEFDASVRVDFADTTDAGARQRYDGMANVPLIDDELALRMVGYYRDEAGWVDAPLAGVDNSTVDFGGRVSLAWTPNDRFLGRFEFLYQDSDPDHSDQWRPELGKFVSRASIPTPRPSELTQYNLTLEYDFENFATLTSSSSYQESETAAFFDQGDAFGLGLTLVQRSDPWGSENFSQEFRLVSNTDSNIEWVLGAFYIDRQADIDFLLDTVGLQAFADSLGAQIDSDTYFSTHIVNKGEEKALFGEMSYSFSEQWKLTAGGRWFDTEVGYYEAERSAFDFASLSYVTQTLSNEGGDSDSTWRVMLGYDPVDDLHFYGSVSKGFRIGQANANRGPSFVDPSDIVIPETYESDETINYELGAKTRLLDGRVQFNAAVYHIEWSNIQIAGSRRSDFMSYVVNSGEAISQGVEMELEIAPNDQWDVALSLTCQDAEIEKISADESFMTGAQRGDTLPGLVDFKASGYVQYTWDGFAGHQMYARLAAQYVEESPNDFMLSPGMRDNPGFAYSSAYTNVDAGLGLTSDRWDATLYVENLANNDDFILIGNGTTGVDYVNTLRPRTIGVRAVYFF